MINKNDNSNGDISFALVSLQSTVSAQAGSSLGNTILHVPTCTSTSERAT